MSSKQKQAQYRQNLISTDFILTPSDNQIRVFITGQVLSANNFPSQQIFVSYKFHLPQQWKAQFPQQYTDIHLTEEQLQQLNCLESITHSVSPVVVKSKSAGFMNQFYFSFPFDLQLIVSQQNAEKQWPKILFQVFSKDSWDRIYMRGCGYVNLPSKQGTHYLESQTWKPALSASSKLSEFFLGGLVRPKRLEDISFPWHLNEQDQLRPINRSQFCTQSSGTVKFRVNISTHSKKVKMDQRTNYKAYKKSYQTQVRRNQLDRDEMNSLPSNFNTEIGTGGRFTNTKLLSN